MWQKEYEKWVNNLDLEGTLKQELNSMKLDEIKESFYTYLEFGTGGMRGILGVGTNKMNIYTIRRANLGLAKYLVENYQNQAITVVIAYDNRHMSTEFALECAKVLGTFNIKTYIFSSLRPTPELSFAVRYLKATSGIVITASHNPKEYNGYKIYDHDGCQYVPQYADKIIKLVEECEDIFLIETLSKEELLEKGLLEYIDEEIDEKYIEKVKSIQLNKELPKELSVVFTPLHGASSSIGYKVITDLGYQCFPVKEQMTPCPDFKYTKTPNPENKEAYEKAVDLCKKMKCNLIIATDPDGDRLGVVVYKEKEFIYLTGNQTGAILIHYILSQREKLGLSNKNGIIFDTIVTSDLGKKIASKYKVETRSTLTGFKFIGQQAKLLENTDKKYLFGYEESYGYLINDFVRDKDSIQSIVMILEAANYYKNIENKDLYDKLIEIYEEFGYYLDGIKNIVLEGMNGNERIKKIVAHFREKEYTEILKEKIKYKDDYLNGVRKDLILDKESEINLPSSNVVKFVFENENWFVLRPSGTEPKLKIYASFKNESMKRAKEEMNDLFDYVLKEIDKIK